MDNQYPTVKEAYSFALRIVKVCEELREKETPSFLIEQLLSSATNIGLKIVDFDVLSKITTIESQINSSLAEVAKSDYWLSILKDCDYIDEETANSLIEDCRNLENALKSTIDITKRLKGTF